MLDPYSSRAIFLFKSYVTSLLKTFQWLLLTFGIKSKVLPGLLPPGGCMAFSTSLLPHSSTPTPIGHAASLLADPPTCQLFLTSLPALARRVTHTWNFLSQPSLSGFLSDWIQISALTSPPPRSLPWPFLENSPPITNPALSLSLLFPIFIFSSLHL